LKGFRLGICQPYRFAGGGVEKFGASNGQRFTAKIYCEILLRSFAAKFCQGTLPQDFALKRVVLIGRTECFGKETQTDGSDFR
jgi:hypothetical protein